LLSNALKFTVDGEIKVTVNCIDEILEISVQDTGCGINKEDQEKLFRVFGCLDRTTHINTQGVGLGLTICRSIVE
jgi:signal transduction histidine kinase